MDRTRVSSGEKMRSSEQTSSLDSTCLTTDYFLTTNLPGYVNRLYRELIEMNPYSAKTIRNYIEAEKVEINIKESTMADKIKKLCWLSRYLDHKSFTNMTKQDIVDYLGSVRKPESEDPGHRSIGTYNGIRIVLLKFFRWLYNPDEPDHHKRTTPPCMNGIKELRRKERSPYRPEDMWKSEDHEIFLKYCNVPRDRCWHAMANDTSARPHELLNLKIKDVVFKKSNDGIQYAEIHVSGKTTSRTLPLIRSIPYVKEWLNVHPFASNSKAPLFISIGRKNFGDPLTRDGMLKHYQEHYRDDYFPKLLDNPAIETREKEIIRKLLNKPWNLYVQRHSALTDKSQILKESILRDHAGWSMTSNMPSVYLHYLGTESSNSILQAYGVITDDNKKQVNGLVPKQCPSCNEPNKPESKFCVECKMILTFDAYSETLSKDREKELEIKSMQDKMTAIEVSQREIADLLKEPAKLLEILEK